MISTKENMSFSSLNLLSWLNFFLSVVLPKISTINIVSTSGSYISVFMLHVRHLELSYNDLCHLWLLGLTVRSLGHSFSFYVTFSFLELLNIERSVFIKSSRRWPQNPTMTMLTALEGSFHASGTAIATPEAFSASLYD